MSKYSIDSATLTEIADAIRSKTNKSDKILVSNMAAEISEFFVTSPKMWDLVVEPNTSRQYFLPPSGYDAIFSVTVYPITAELLNSLDGNFRSENIAEGMTIFGVTGTHKGSTGSSGIYTATLNDDGDVVLSGMPSSYRVKYILYTADVGIRFETDVISETSYRFGLTAGDSHVVCLIYDTNDELVGACTSNTVSIVL